MHVRIACEFIEAKEKWLLENNMVAILGKSVPVQRINTGLYSFDHAFINREGEVGFPVGKGVEIFGNTFLGKSTITYGLAGIVAKSIQKGGDFYG